MQEIATDYAWVDNGRGGKTFRRIHAPNLNRSDLPCPMVITDTIDQTQSMADGKYYTSKQALRKTYRADGNPQGVEYVELGNEQRPHIQKNGGVVRDRAASRNAVDKALAAVDRGEGIQA